MQDKLEKFEEKDFNVYVELTNGKVFGCDFVVSATGVVPGGEVFKHVANANEEVAIVIDDSMRTLHPDIYAAGDVSQADGHAGGQVHCHPHGRGGV